MRRPSPLRRAVPVLFALCLLAPWLAAQTPAKDLKSKDAVVRLGAVAALAAGEDPRAEKLLLGALKDDDWEVIERAATALGTVGGESSVKPLVKLALTGPAARVRAAAAGALALLGPDEGVSRLSAKVGGKTGEAACAALLIVGPAATETAAPRSLAKKLKSKELRERLYAASATLVLEREERAEVLEELLTSKHLGVRASALEAAALDPRPVQLAVLSRALEAPALNSIVERRCRRALCATLLAHADEAEREREATALLTRLCGRPEARIAERGTRLAADLLRAKLLAGEAAVTALAPAYESPAAGVRAGAARALEEAACAAGWARARALAEGDEAARVRRAALRALVRGPGLEDDDVRAFLLERLAADRSPTVREDLACACASAEHEDLVPPLLAALQDEQWGVACCAAVSLGHTRSGLALEALVRLARDHPDWRLRGAAVVGLRHALQKEGIPALIEALADKEPLVARTSYSYLSTLAQQELPLEVAPWREWWAANEKRIKLWDPAELEARRERFGYGVPASEIYKGIDVLVLDSRGDHIQVLLAELGIQHRLTASGRLERDGLDAGGVFVSNCTGEILRDDVDRLAWFVRVGGSLFGSCWALHETIVPLGTGAVRKLETRGEVLDNVLASSCAEGSPYARGVFDAGVRPIYALQGAHLIEVLEAERVEVLVDSPECAEKWGGGDLACWFTLGHGVILDSVNHFDVQGLELATGLKTGEERMGYAVDHMGYGYEELRTTRKAKWWDSTTKAAREVRDLTVFRLVTNFVRLRRSEGR